MPALPEGATAISVTATKGRFLWAGDTVPLARFVVRDPNPGGRTISLSGGAIATVTQDKQTWKVANLPVSAFRSTIPALASSLFATVTLSGLTLRYAR